VPRTPEEFSRLTFNHKCHEDALCTKLNTTENNPKSPNRGKEPSFMCNCKAGLVALPDLSSCVDPNGAVAIHSDFFFQTFVLIPCLTFIVHFYR
jgi:hypothetical protein